MSDNSKLAKNSWLRDNRDECYFSYMIDDIKNVLKYSEDNIELQYHKKLESIPSSSDFEFDDYDEFIRFNEDIEHWKDDAKKRFTETMSLRIRYNAIFSLVFSVDLSVKMLINRLEKKLENKKPKGMNETVHYLTNLCALTEVESSEVINNYEVIIYLRNCIAHNAGFKEGYQYENDLNKIDSLKGLYFKEVEFFLGEQIFIEKEALNGYIDDISELIFKIQEECYAQNLINASKGLRCPYIDN